MSKSKKKKKTLYSINDLRPEKPDGIRIILKFWSSSPNSLRIWEESVYKSSWKLKFITCIRFSHHNGRFITFHDHTISNYYSCSGRSLDRVPPSKIWLPRFLIFFQPLTSWRLSEAVSVSMVWMLSNYYSLVVGV